jgi:hypothetical protein
MRIDPESILRSPVIASTSSLCPLPWTPAMDDELHRTPDHHPRQLRLGRVGRRGAARDLAPSQDGDAVGDLQHLLELVGDEDDRGPFLGEGPHDLEELLGLLGRQDGGGLVEDEDVRLSVEGLDDLDALADPDRQVLDQRVGRNAQVVPVGEFHDARTGGRLVEAAEWGARGLDPEHDVLGDGEDRDEHEVLVDHPDPRGDRVAGVVEGDELVVDEDLALIRLIEAVEDVHERGLARPVLAEQAEDLATIDAQVDAVVGDDAREALGDPP